MTLSYEQLFKTIRDYKKDIKNSSVKSYVNTLLKIQSQDFNMKDEDSIIDFFENIDEKFKKKR